MGKLFIVFMVTVLSASAQAEVVKAEANSAISPDILKAAEKAFQEDPSIEMIILRKRKKIESLPIERDGNISTEDSAQENITRSNVLPERNASEMDQKIDAMAEDLKTEIRDYLLQSVDKMKISVVRER